MHFISHVFSNPTREGNNGVESPSHSISWAEAVDGLCSPCEDPDLCLTYALCPLCRQVRVNVGHKLAFFEPWAYDTFCGTGRAVT